MKTHRIAAIGVGVLAAASLALAGCKSTTNANAPSPGASSTAGSPSMSPQAALLAAVAHLKTTGYDISVTSSQGNVSGTGSIDPGKSAAINAMGSFQGQDLQFNGVQIGTDAYIKVDLGQLNSTFGIPTQWMKIDTTKINKPLFDFGSGSPFDVAKLAGAVTNLSQPDANHISGTIDFSKIGSSTSPAPGGSAPAPGGSAGPGLAKTATFRATLDDQGRITELTINGGPNQSMIADIKITNYGSPTPVTAPSDSVPAPDAIYQFLNR